MKRRVFLQRSAAATLSTAAPLVVSKRLAGAAAPSERVSIGFIGLGNQSRGDLPAFLDNDDVEPGPGWKAEPVPAGFDYNMWLGPAPLAPYHSGRCFYRFRFNLDYSGGQVTNFGTHMLDIAQWGHGSDDSGPVAFEDAGSQWPEPGSLYTTATRVAFKATYQDGVELTCETKPKTSLCRFVGTDGWVEYQSGKLEMSAGIDTNLTTADIRLPLGNPQRTENDYKNYLPDHIRNFINSVKSRDETISPVASGHRTASICHLGNIAMRLKRSIQWNPDTESIIGDDEAIAMLSRTPREPWTYGS